MISTPPILKLNETKTTTETLPEDVRRRFIFSDAFLDTLCQISLNYDTCGGIHTGKKLDPATELYYFNQRYYDPEIGRFLTEDPAGQYMNPYLYAANSPLNYYDPDGLWGIGLNLWVISFRIGDDGISGGVFGVTAGVDFKDGSVYGGYNATIGFELGPVKAELGGSYKHNFTNGGVDSLSGSAGVSAFDTRLGYSHDFASGVDKLNLLNTSVSNLSLGYNHNLTTGVGVGNASYDLPVSLGPINANLGLQGQHNFASGADSLATYANVSKSGSHSIGGANFDIGGKFGYNYDLLTGEGAFSGNANINGAVPIMGEKFNVGGYNYNYSSQNGQVKGGGSYSPLIRKIFKF
jgi:RHS repeat-associated protein